MKFAIQITGNPYDNQAPDSAYNFVLAAIEKGHTIERIFFYHGAVGAITGLADPPPDDRNIPKRWSDLALKHGIDLVACVTASARRGIKDGNIVRGARISGLGQLVDMIVTADRFITFG